MTASILILFVCLALLGAAGIYMIRQGGLFSVLLGSIALLAVIAGVAVVVILMQPGVTPGCASC